MSKQLTMKQLEQLAIRRLQKRQCIDGGELFLPSDERQRRCPRHQENYYEPKLAEKRCNACGARFKPPTGKFRNCEDCRGFMNKKESSAS